MPKRLSTIALTSLALTYLFFAEYLSPFRSVYIPFDLWGYHYPLMDFAFQSLRRFSFPAWDPTIYCGQPFAANIQAALFYPPAWLLYALSAAHDHLPYRSLEIFVFAHIWVAFLLCFCWLRNKRLSDLACILGASIFAYSGYAMLQLQHQGLLAGYAWLPLGLWGIDDLTENQTHRGFLKLTAASAAAFLAGYPPIWIVLAIYWSVYALFSRRLLLTLSAISASLLLSAVQLLPALEASSLMVKENRYGLGIRDLAFYLSYLIPNFYDFGINVPSMTNPGREYLYLGAPAIFGIAALLTYRRANILPLLAAGAVCVIFLTNPFNAISALSEKIQFFGQVCGAWYFLAGITATAAALAAIGIDQFLLREHKPISNAWTIATILIAAAWSIYELHAWHTSAFRPGWPSALDAIAALIVFTLCIVVTRARPTIAVVLLLAVAIDYKSFGTSKRFNAFEGSLPHEYARDGFFAMDPQAFQALASHPQYRILSDFTAPMPVELRHHALSSPQGGDPFVTQRYLEFVRNLGAHSESNRELSFDSDNQQAMDTLAVRYVLTTRNGPLYPHLKANPAFKLLGSDGAYFRVYEYQNVKEPFIGTATLLSRTPEVRKFHAAGPGFVLKEQFFPGWRAYLDGREIPIQLWHGAFQAVQLPSGDHNLEFRYHPQSLIIGAWISLSTLLLLLFSPKSATLFPSLSARYRFHPPRP